MMITAALICNDIGSIDTVEFCSNLECSVGAPQAFISASVALHLIFLKRKHETACNAEIPFNKIVTKLMFLGGCHFTDPWN